LILWLYARWSVEFVLVYISDLNKPGVNLGKLGAVLSELVLPFFLPPLSAFANTVGDAFARPRLEKAPRQLNNWRVFAFLFPGGGGSHTQTFAHR
jgi:hypothetical protein